MRMLPDASDLVSEGWKRVDERSWRTGRTGTPSEWGLRARELKSITAWRSFEQKAASKWLWTEVVPLSSADDAGLALRDVPIGFLKNLRAEVTLTDEHTVDGVTVPGSQATWAYEQETSGPRGLGMARYLGGTVGPILFLVAGSGLAEAWTWDDLVSVAETLVLKISQATD